MSEESLPPGSSDDIFQTAEALRHHLMKHTVAMSFSRLSSPNPATWRFATGLLLTLDDRNYLVTVDHWIAELREALDQKDLEFVVVRFRHAKGGMTSFRLDPQSVWNSSLSDDIAWLEIPSPLLDALQQNEAQFLDANEAQTGPFDGRYMAIVGGYPTALIETKQETSRLIYVHGGKLQNHVIAGLDAISFLTTCVSPLDGEEFTPDSSSDGVIEVRPTTGKLCSNPDVPVDSAVGISGGPIVCFRLDLPAAARPVLKLLAMQFSQVKSGERIRYLRATSAQRIIEDIRKAGAEP